MQPVSNTYKNITAGDGYWYEYKLTIDDVGTFYNAQIYNLKANNKTFTGKPEIGKAVAGEVDISMLKPAAAIPRMATLRPFVRACNSSQQSEWIPQGVYFIDTRNVTNNGNGLEKIAIHGFDAMAKAEQDYPDTEHDWPYLDKNVVAEIASEIGVEVDSRTNSFLSAGYKIDLPVGYTMRETLEHIAAMNAGNFIMSNEGKLLFVPLFGLNSDEWITGNYLADENGNALAFGNEGWYILV